MNHISVRFVVISSFLLLAFICALPACNNQRRDEISRRSSEVPFVINGYLPVRIPGHVDPKVSRKPYYDPNQTSITAKKFDLDVSTATQGGLGPFFEEYFDGDFLRRLEEELSKQRWDEVKAKLDVLRQMSDLEIFRWLYDPAKNREDPEFWKMMFGSLHGKEWLGKIRYGEKRVRGGGEVGHKTLTLAWVLFSRDRSADAARGAILFQCSLEGTRVVDGGLFGDLSVLERGGAGEAFESLFPGAEDGGSD